MAAATNIVQQTTIECHALLKDRIAWALSLRSAACTKAEAAIIVVGPLAVKRRPI
jgi:hypothetical protein